VNANPRAIPSPRLRGELHHARMTLLPIIAEGGSSFNVVMLAVEALYRVELLVRGQRIEAERYEESIAANAKAQETNLKDKP